MGNVKKYIYINKRYVIINRDILKYIKKIYISLCIYIF